MVYDTEYERDDEMSITTEMSIGDAFEGFESFKLYFECEFDKGKQMITGLKKFKVPYQVVYSTIEHNGAATPTMKVWYSIRKWSHRKAVHRITTGSPLPFKRKRTGKSIIETNGVLSFSRPGLRLTQMKLLNLLQT